MRNSHHVRVLAGTALPPPVFDRTAAVPLNVVLFGPPGAGKGTQADRFALRYGIPKISTGDILRKAIHAKTRLGRLVKDTLRRGELVNDDVMIQVVGERLGQSDTARGFVLDGFPRTVRQAQALDELVPAVLIIGLEVAPETLVSRLAARRRSDDDRQVIRERLKIYETTTKPVLDYYRRRSTIAIVNGDRAPDEVSADIDRSVENLRI